MVSYYEKLGDAKTCETLKTHIHYRNAYYHQTLQASYIQWGPYLNKVTRTFDHMVLQGHTTNSICYISTTTMTIVTKLSLMVTYKEGLSSIRSQDPLAMWSCKVTWEMKYVISVLPQGLWSLNFARLWINIRGFHAKSHAIFYEAKRHI